MQEIIKRHLADTVKRRLHNNPAVAILEASFEGFAMENILAFANNYEPSFYRTSAGAEIDLILRRGRRTLAFELKSSTVPRVSKGFWNALNDISPDEAYVVAPVKESYPMKGGVMVSPLQEIITKLQKKMPGIKPTHLTKPVLSPSL